MTDCLPSLLVTTATALRLLPSIADEFRVLDWNATPGELAEVRAILAGGNEPLCEAEMARLPRLGLIATIAAGYEGVDMSAAHARGIRVRNVSGVNAEDVADYAVGAMIALRRKLLDNDAHVRSGRWASEGRLPLARSLGGDRVGIVGLGAIGSAIARRVQTFRLPVQWWGPRPRPGEPLPRVETLEQLAAQSTVLFLACPGGPETRRLVDTHIIDALGPEGLIVNVARGSVIDQEALIRALVEGRLGQAALDVFESEPTNLGNVVPASRLLLSPHMAGATEDAILEQIRCAVANVRQFLRAL